MKSPEDRASWFPEESAGSLQQPVRKFGFHMATCCGYMPQNNEWKDSWSDFYTHNRLKHQVDLLMNEDADRDLGVLWPQLQRKISSFFQNCGEIVPALLHGDLWSGNVAETDTEPGTLFLFIFQTSS